MEQAVSAAEQAVAPTDFKIVNLKALPFVGLVLIALLVAVVTKSPWAVDFFHVVGGAFWTILDLFLGFVIGPIMGRLTIPARTEFTKKLMPKMLLIMPTTVLCTLVAGYELATIQHRFSPHSISHPWLVASYIVVGIMALIALGILEPANLAVLFELRNPIPNGEIIGTLMKRFIYTAALTGAMQVATLIIMTRLATQ